MTISNRTVLAALVVECRSPAVCHRLLTYQGYGRFVVAGVEDLGSTVDMLCLSASCVWQTEWWIAWRRKFGAHVGRVVRRTKLMARQTERDSCSLPAEV